MKYFYGLMLCIIYLLVLVTSYIVHLNFFKVNVVFYDAILDVTIATAFMIVVLYLLRRKYNFNSFESLQLIIIFILSGYCLAISIPTVIDRSLSFYILEKINQRGGGIRQDAFQDVFINEYMKEHRLVDVRLTEQLESGTIEIVNGCVKLTEKGLALATFSNYFRHHLLPKSRLLMGSYTDDLTHPLDNNNVTVSYQCQ